MKPATETVSCPDFRSESIASDEKGTEETQIEIEMEHLAVTDGENEGTRGGSFKRRVSKLMQNKEVWEEAAREIRERDFGTLAQKMLKKSSIYAVSQVGHAESNYRKMLWVLVLIVGLSGCIYEVVKFLTLYFQYPVVVNVNIDNRWDLTFPAVTVCNLNRMKRQYVRCLGRNEPIEVCGNRSGGIATAVVSSERTAIATCSSLVSGVQDSHWKANMDLLTKYSKLDSKKRWAAGHQFDKLIRNCSFNGKTCSSTHFSLLQNLRYGNCFTFNKRVNASTELLTTTSVGAMSGLDLILDLEPKDYIPLTSSTGARVLVHDPEDDTSPEEEGFNVSPGYETSVAVKQICYRRLPHPYKDHCAEYGRSSGVRGRNQGECIRMCVQEQSYAICKCVDPTLPTYGDLPLCNMMDSNDTCCLDRTLNAMAKNGLPCSCPLACFMPTYKVRLSTAFWPAPSVEYERYCDYCTDEENLKHVRQRQARVKVYYSSLERTVFEQKEMFQNSELFSHLGGQLGLWLGLSLVALFELVENVAYLTRYFSKNYCSKEREKSNRH